MRSNLPQGSDGRGAQKKEDPSGSETDPLLPSATERRIPRSLADNHHSGSIRARRSSRSPQTTTDAQMERIPETPQSDQYHDERFYNTTDSYTLHTDNETLTTRSQLTDGFSRMSHQNSVQQQFYQQRRHSNVYMQQPDDHPMMAKDRNVPGQPPLLEIPEEIYAVRKAALQVLKPLTSSWVSPLQRLFCPMYCFYLCSTCISFVPPRRNLANSLLSQLDLQ